MKWPSAMVMLALALGASGCARSSRAHPPTIEQPHGPISAAPFAESGSRRYRECFTASGDDAQAGVRCLDEELVYRQRSLDALYQDWTVELDAAQRVALHAEHRTWEQDTDRQCGPAAGARPVDRICRLDQILARYEVLNYRLSNATPAHWAEDVPDSNGAVEMHLGDAMISLRSDGCTNRNTSRLICSNARLSIRTPTLQRQTLLLPEVVFPDTPRPGQAPAATGFRGSLHAGFAEGHYGIMLSDIDMDGHEDLMVWSGLDGTLGDPSYTYYLYESETRRLVENVALAKLMEGHSLSRIVDGRLFAWYRSGPCDRGEKTIAVRNGVPEVLEREDYATCRGGSLEPGRIRERPESRGKRP